MNFNFLTVLFFYTTILVSILYIVRINKQSSNNIQSYIPMTCTTSPDTLVGGSAGTCTFPCTSIPTTLETISTSWDLKIKQDSETDNYPIITKLGDTCSIAFYAYSRGSSTVKFRAGGYLGTITNVSCILENVLVLTNRGPLKAQDITIKDSLLQLDGKYKKIKRIDASLAYDDLFKCGDVILTGWHPIRKFNESEYKIARIHEGFKKYKGSGNVYNFMLESETDDILFWNSDIIAESLNDYPHGVQVKRSL
jgi:hypothetical protein